MERGWCRVTENGISAFAACREGLLGRFGKLRRGVFLTLKEFRMIGGKREGAGRKPGRGERKASLTVGVTPTLREFLDSRSGSISDAVEDAVRRTKKFREWLKAR